MLKKSFIRECPAVYLIWFINLSIDWGAMTFCITSICVINYWIAICFICFVNMWPVTKKKYWRENFNIVYFLFKYFLSSAIWNLECADNDDFELGSMYIFSRHFWCFTVRNNFKCMTKQLSLRENFSFLQICCRQIFVIG